MTNALAAAKARGREALQNAVVSPCKIETADLRLILDDLDAGARAIAALSLISRKGEWSGTSGVTAPDGVDCPYIDTGSGCIVVWHGMILPVDYECGAVDFPPPPAKDDTNG
jgi:hypothetical protein